MSEFLERYKPGQPVQQGTVGQTFTAIDLQKNRPAIIKHIACSSKEAAAAALQEWARLLPVRHPALVQVFETDLDELDFYMALEYVEGTSLRRLIPSLPERATSREGLEQVFWSARAVLEALSALHRAGVAHGDLCPENIWLGERVIVLDSGLARLARLAATPEDPRVRSALNAIPIGNPAYRAPELALGAMPTLASDMYSLGVILHESLTGKLPNSEEIDLPDNLAEIEPLVNMISSLLSFHADQRPDVLAATGALDELLNTPPELVRRLSRERTRQTSSRVVAEEAEVYQARAALLLETNPLQRAQLRRSIAAHLARRMSHSEAMDECRAGHEDAAHITDPKDKARAIANLISVEMQICFNQARFDEAISLGQQALELLSQAGLGQSDTKEACRVYVKLARIYYRMGRQPEFNQALERARAMATATGYGAGLAEADAVDAMNQGWTKGKLDEGIALAQRSLDKALTLNLEWLQSEAHRIIGGCYQYRNDLPNSRIHYRKALEIAERVDLPDLMASALYNLGLMCEIEGDFAGCEHYFRRALEMAGKANLPRTQAVAYKGLNLLYEQLGRLPEAYEQARLSLRLLQEINDQQLIPDANYQVGLICLQMGRVEESEAFINTGREIAVATGNHLILLELERLAAALRLQQGRLDEAEELLTQAYGRADNQLSETLLYLNHVELELAVARLEARATEAGLVPSEMPELVGEYITLAQRSADILEGARETKPSLEARFLAIHGRILALAEQWGEAEAAFKQAIQRADELKQRLVLAQALHLYGRSLLERVQTGSTGRLGQRGRAMGLLANAKAVYSECAAQPGVDKVNRLLQQVHGH